MYHYTLVLYARLCKPPGGSEEKWEHFNRNAENDKDVFLIYNTIGNVIIAHGEVILESFYLCYGRSKHRLFYHEATLVFVIDTSLSAMKPAKSDSDHLTDVEGATSSSQSQGSLKKESVRDLFEEVGVRKFRVKFQSIKDREHFCRLIAEFVDVSEVVTNEDQLLFNEGSPMTILSPLEVVPLNQGSDRFKWLKTFDVKAEEVLSKTGSDTQTSQEEELQLNINLSGQAIDGLIKFCLMDPNFRSFVDVVERRLEEMLDNKEDEVGDDVDLDIS